MTNNIPRRNLWANPPQEIPQNTPHKTPQKMQKKTQQNMPQSKPEKTVAHYIRRNLNQGLLEKNNEI